MPIIFPRDAGKLGTLSSYVTATPWNTPPPSPASGRRRWSSAWGYPSAAEPSVEVTLFVGYPKQDKLEQVIRHGVELGCTHFVPFFSRYCVAAPKEGSRKRALQPHRL